MKRYPERNVIYTGQEVLSELSLPDSPYLQFTFNGKLTPIQNVGSIAEDSVVWKESKWKYLRTTYESIPIFVLVDSSVDIKELVHIEIHIDPFEEEDFGYYAYPVGQVENQFYKIDKEKNRIVCEFGTCSSEYAIPEVLAEALANFVN